MIHFLRLFPQSNMKGEHMKRKYKILIIGIVLFVLLILGGLFFLRSMTYLPLDEAIEETMPSNQHYQVKETSDAVIFKPLKESHPTSVIFYQGGLVEEKSYSSLAAKLASKGFPVYLVKHALNLAVTDTNKAEKLIVDENITDFVIGGHSLGGVMASRFANEIDSDLLKGVFLLASYPDEKGRLDTLPISVLSLVGSKDGVLDNEAYQDGKTYLPDSTSYYIIEGGNHAGFGDYGHQEGDNDASISHEEQQELTVQFLVEWLNKIEE